MQFLAFLGVVFIVFCVFFFLGWVASAEHELRKRRW